MSISPFSGSKNRSAILRAQTAPKTNRVAESAKSSALKWELSYLALSGIDTAQTIDCLQRKLCQEGNPIFGKNPSASKLILAKVALGAVHFAAFSEDTLSR